MSFLVTARKFRPKTFQEVVAQKHVVNTLRNAIRMGRIAHAYLFCGPRGVGKTTTARIFAKALNCRNAVDGEPCNACETCIEIAEGRCMDIIEIDGASNNGVDQARSIREAVRFVPAREKYKMYIIDEVHMLSDSAFNALLKTLEEPPPHALFIFATTEVHKLPATILSRCQRFDFKRMETEEIVGQLRFIAGEEKIAIDDETLYIIARRADGSMRDAESIFDQVVAFTGTTVAGEAARDILHVIDADKYFHLTDLIKRKDTKGGFALAEEIMMSGFDIQEFLAGTEEHFRNLLIARTTGEARLIEAADSVRRRYLEEAPLFAEGDILRFLRLTAEAIQAVRFGAQPRLKFEIALVRMIKMDSTVAIADLLSQLDAARGAGGSGGGGYRVQMEGRAGASPAAPQKAPHGVSHAPSGAIAAASAGLQAGSFAGVPSGATAVPLSLDLVSRQWREFTDSVRNFRMTLAMTLEECRPVRMEGNTLQIICANDFLYGQLHASAPALTERFHSFFGRPIRYEFVRTAPAGFAAAPAAQPEPAPPPKRLPSPIVQFLIDEIGAEIIE